MPASRRLIVAAAVALSAGAAAVTLPALPSLARSGPRLVRVAAEGEPVPGQYIVTLKPGASTATESDKVRAKDVKRFDGVLNGFSAKLDSGQLDQLRRSKKVTAIERNQTVRMAAVQRELLSWGLDRIDQRALPLSKSYSYRFRGRGVTAYVIDTGIRPGHPQFGGRARSVWSAPRFRGDGLDGNGHGTHVAGTIGSSFFGVAKLVQLRSLRVLDQYGDGYMDDVIAAVRWLRQHASKPAVANLSVGGDHSPALNTAVANLSRSGVFVSVAAGNDGTNACGTSPAGAPSVMTVGATTPRDTRPAFSNWGKCVDIFAPGVNILSTWPRTRGRLSTGTSMAAPHVSGVAALYLTSHPRAGFAEVERWLINNSTKGKISGLPGQTPNRLLFKSGL